MPGWLLGVAGFYVALCGPALAAVVAASGVVTLRARRGVPAALYRWCVAGVVLTVALAVFMLTPLGQTIALFTAD